MSGPWIRRAGPLAALLVLAGAERAEAHLLGTGLGPFYDGAIHLLATPGDLLPIVALALLGGQRGPRGGRLVLFVLPPAWLVGGLVGALVGGPLIGASAPAALTVVLGAGVAADQPLPAAAVGAGAIGLGLLGGIAGGRELAAGDAGLAAAAGSLAALFVLVALLAGRVATLRAAAARIAVRVAGSWLAAVGLLTLGWSLRAA